MQRKIFEKMLVLFFLSATCFSILSVDAAVFNVETGAFENGSKMLAVNDGKLKYYVDGKLICYFMMQCRGPSFKHFQSSGKSSEMTFNAEKKEYEIKGRIKNTEATWYISIKHLPNGKIRFKSIVKNSPEAIKMVKQIAMFFPKNVMLTDTVCTVTDEKNQNVAYRIGEPEKKDN